MTRFQLHALCLVVAYILWAEANLLFSPRELHQFGQGESGEAQPVWPATPTSDLGKEAYDSRRDFDQW